MAALGHHTGASPSFLPRISLTINYRVSCVLHFCSSSIVKFADGRNNKMLRPFKELNNLCIIEKNQSILETKVADENSLFASLLSQ